MKKYILFFTLIVGLLSSCTKNFEEINTNPNAPEDVPNTYKLLNAIAGSSSRIHGASMNMTYAGLWVQHYAKIQYLDEDLYAYRPDAMDAHWIGLYAGPLYDLQSIINSATDEEVNMKAVAMVMKSYIFSVITDMWGDAPYSEALMGTAELTPAYDTQESIYAGLLADLEDAAAVLKNSVDNSSTEDLGNGDILYGGDLDKWMRFANSLRVRLLVRTSDRDAGAYAAAMAIINSGNVFTSNADNASLYFVGDASYPNPLYENKYFNGRNDHAVSKTLTDLMNAGGFATVMDPRLAVYAEMNDGLVYEGQPSGSSQPTPLTSVSQIGSAFRDDPTAPVHLMTYAELKFFEAEAANDKQAYLDGITASHDMYGLSTDATYMTEADAAWLLDMKKALGEQKWIALFGNGCEAFSEFRRLDHPTTIVEVPNSVYPGDGVPLRFPYSSTENLTNGENYSSAISSQGIDATGLFAKVWWDAN